MSLFESIILGIVQGLTEFLPISSTAHLRIIPSLVGWEDPGAPFTAVTQLGTMLAVMLYFREDLLTLARAAMSPFQKDSRQLTSDARLLVGIALGTVPIVIAGLAFKSLIEDEFRSLYVISVALILLALLLVVAEKVSSRSRGLPSLTWKDSVLVGLAQAVALIPGSSRSGTTMTAGLFLDFDRETAARFSFLLSIPSVALSGLYQLYKLRHDIVGSLGFPLIVATVVSGIVGYASIAMLLRYLKRHSMYVFVWYRLLLGAFILLLLSLGWLVP